MHVTDLYGFKYFGAVKKTLLVPETESKSPRISIILWDFRDKELQ